MLRWVGWIACRRGERACLFEVIEEASSYAAAVTACSRTLTAAADAGLGTSCNNQCRSSRTHIATRCKHQLAPHQDQQQLPLFPRQLLQQLQELHRQHEAPSITAPVAQRQHKQHQHTVHIPPCVQLAHYQQRAVSEIVAQLGCLKQRLPIRLPPSADTNPIITFLTTQLSPSYNVMVLVSSSARAAALKEQLKPLLQAAEITPRLVPGELLVGQQPVVIVDLQQLLRVPSASIQLQQQQLSVQRGVVIYEEGFLQHDPHGISSDVDDSNSSSKWLLYNGRLRAAAEQLLRSMRYLEPHPNKMLLTLSSRGWHLSLPQQQQQQQNAATSSGGGGSDWQASGWQLPRSEAVSAGLIRAPAAISIPTTTQIPSHVLLAAGSSKTQTTSSDELCTLLSSSSRNVLVAAAFNAVAGKEGKGLVYASGHHHARQLAVALNLQGISSLVLHEQQSPEDQAAVLQEFNIGNDRVLVTSIPAEQAATLNLSNTSARVCCVLMAGPVMNAAEYAAKLAPVLLPAAAAAGPMHRSMAASADDNSKEQMIVIDFVDQIMHTAKDSSAAAAGVPVGINAAAAAGQRQQPQTRRRRRSKTDASNAATDGTIPSWVKVGIVGSSSLQPLTCADVLGDICTMMPLPAALAAAITGDSSSSSTQRSSRSEKGKAPAATQEVPAATAAAEQAPEQQQQRAQGDLIWTILDDGSWAIPIRRGRGVSMTGLVILWLRKARKNYVPELEEGLGQLAPLPGTSGKPINLQRARSLAEQWTRLHYPSEAALRELGLEWRERPMTDGQMMFCNRHNIPYDASWSRGTVMNNIDRFIVEKMHEPPTEKQLFLVRHFAPLAPASMTHASSSSIAYKSAADNFLQALLVGQLTTTISSSSGSSGSRGPGRPSAAAAAAAARDADGSSSSNENALPARRALLADLNAYWDAGLRPKYTWMVVNKDSLLLDLLSGGYLWLRPAKAAASSSSSNVHNAPNNAPLNPQVLYNLTLELPDGSHHPISNPVSAAALLTTHTASYTTDTAAAAAATSIPSSSRPLPLPAAVDQAEKVVALLVSHHQAFVGRAANRLVGMVGGWKIPPKSSEAQMALPASTRQLELLKTHGLPYSRNYTCLDAHRELVRHMKSTGLPEPPATANQLARIRELQLPLNTAAAATLTAAEARAMLFKAQLVEEQAAAAAAKKAAERTGRARKSRKARELR